MPMNTFQWRSLKTQVTLLSLVLVAFSIWSVALYSSRMLREDMEHMLGEQQFSTVTGIAREIDGGLIDRMHALETIAQELSPDALGNAASMQTLLEQRPLLQLLFNGGVFVTGTGGTALADVPVSAGRLGTNYLDRETVSIPLKEGRTLIGPPGMGKRLSAPIFSIAAPIRDSKGQVIGVIVGTINLSEPNFLDQISHSSYGKSGGFLLMDVQHKLIVTATDKSRVLQPLPAPGLNSMHDRYIQGYEGFGTAVSSRGILELSAGKRIPSAGWYLVAALPATEAFAPVDSMLGRLFVSATIATVLAAALTGWLISRMLRQRFAPMLAASRAIAGRSRSEQPISALPVQRQDEFGELITSFNVLLENYAQREKLLKLSESFKSAVLNSLDAEIAVVDRSGVIQAVNARWTRFSLENSPVAGTPTPHTGLGINYLSVCVPDSAGVRQDMLDIHQGLLSVLEGRLPRFSVEYPCDSPQRQRWFSMTAMPLGSDAHGGAVITHTDITQRKQSEAHLQLAASVFREAHEGIIIASDDGTILEVNEAFARITGYSHAEVIGQRPSILHSGQQGPEFYRAMWSTLKEKGHWSGEIWNRRKNGEVYAELLNISAVLDAQGIVRQYVALFSDITAIKQHQSQLEHIAHFDALTNLPNRVLLADRLQQAMLQTVRRVQKLAVVYLDLDGFKNVNDRHGHHVGDQLLLALAQTMSAALREGDTLARIGGDEFVAVLIDLVSTADCMPLLNRLLQAAAAPIPLAELTLHCSASIGVTFYPQADEVEADQLLRQADQAMYQAKLEGKNRIQFFDPARGRDIRDELALAGVIQNCDL